MKIKVSGATNIQLNWLVAKCEGYAEQWKYGIPDSDNRYTTDWAQGGPIIERERIFVKPNVSNIDWRSYMIPISGYGIKHAVFGPTPLIAAMRSYCVSKLGDEVEIPKELL